MYLIWYSYSLDLTGILNRTKGKKTMIQLWFLLESLLRPTLSVS
jgi:hypothetical protein